MEVFAKNAGYTPRAEVYRAQLEKAAELSDWKKLWHPRGEGGAGPVKRGLGIGVSTWGGGGHASQCRATINPDGSVEVEIGSQDLGTGTRTIIAHGGGRNAGTADDRHHSCGSATTRYPPSGASGGSTTVGGVSSSTRKATMNALAKLFEVVAPALGAQPDQLEAVDGSIQVKGNAAKSLTWKAACRKLGTSKISEMGENEPRNPRGLNASGVGGVQIADVSVDIETGIVKMNKFVAVQDCGLIINPRTGRKPVLRRHHHGHLHGALRRAHHGPGHRPHDQRRHGVLQAGRHRRHRRDRGAPGYRAGARQARRDRPGRTAGDRHSAAIANAVANAIGVRVPTVPDDAGHGCWPRSKGGMRNASLRICQSRHRAGGPRPARREAGAKRTCWPAAPTCSP